MWYVLTVAIINLALGYTVALYVRGSRAACDSTLASDPSIRKATIQLDLPDPQEDADDESQEEEAAVLPEAEAKHLDNVLRDFKDDLSAFRGELSTLDIRMCECSAEPTRESYDSCVADFKQINQTYLKKQGDNIQHYYECKDNLGPLSEIGEKVSRAIDDQAMAVAGTSQAIEAINDEDEVVANHAIVVEQSEVLVQANQQLQASLDEALAEIDEVDARSNSEHDDPLIDPLTKLATMQHLEELFEQWWGKDPHQSRSLALAMIDVDQFDEIREKHGARPADRILRVIAQFVSAGRVEDGVALRIGDYKFALFLPDVDARNATGEVERVRQNIEVTTMSHREEEISITASCAVTGVMKGDTMDSLLNRVETTLEEAKRYGCNRTFLHEGKYPALVVPPNLPIEGRVVSV